MREERGEERKEVCVTLRKGLEYMARLLRSRNVERAIFRYCIGEKICLIAVRRYHLSNIRTMFH